MTKTTDFVPFEHLMYAEKGISALTITTAEKPYTNVYQKYSLFDRDFILDTIAKNIAVISEALARTFVI